MSRFPESELHGPDSESEFGRSRPGVGVAFLRNWLTFSGAIKKRGLHALPASEIYTSEYFSRALQNVASIKGQELQGSEGTLFLGAAFYYAILGKPAAFFYK